MAIELTMDDLLTIRTALRLDLKRAKGAMDRGFTLGLRVRRIEVALEKVRADLCRMEESGDYALDGGWPIDVVPPGYRPDAQQPNPNRDAED